MIKMHRESLVRVTLTAPHGVEGISYFLSLRSEMAGVCCNTSITYETLFQFFVVSYSTKVRNKFLSFKTVTNYLKLVALEHDIFLFHSFYGSEI